ncbi:MAG: flagellin [Candidatus Pelethousia sp.]|nr:flagellin [Candidatus Pelethousia sp.]
MRIQNNITAMNTHRMYTINNNSVSRSAEKLSSGYRINRAGDDAAGLAISEKMRSQVRGLNMASKNSQDAVSLIQTAEGALQEVHSMLQRMNELANQAATGTNETFDRQQIDAEFNQLKEEIDQIADTTSFNNMKLLDGSLGQGTATITNMQESIGLTLSGTGSAIGGTALATATISNWQGVGTSKVGTFSLSFGTLDESTGVFDGSVANGTTLRVTFTDEATGAVETTDLKWSDVYTNNNATDPAADLAAGQTATIDLSNVGLGRITLVGSGSVDNIKLGLTGDIVTEEGTPAGDVGALKIQVGANEGEQLEISVAAMNTSGLGIAGSAINDQAKAGQAITATQKAINTVSEQRATLGAMQNRLEHKIANLDNTSENLSSAESRIRDVDIAKEMTNFTKNNILSQAATAMLAQANAAPQGVLSLLQ